MVDTGRRVMPWDLAVEGTLVCTPDIWGNRFAPPESEVWFRTSDASYISISRNSSFAMALSDADGNFAVTSQNHPRIVAQNSYFLEIKNTATGQVEKVPISQIRFNSMVSFAGTSHIQMDEIQLPWAPAVPVITKVNGKDFKYPADVAHALSVGFKAGSPAQIALVASAAGQPAPDTALDSLLAAIEAEGRAGGSSAKVDKFFSEVTRAMKISLMQVRRPLDVVTLALEKCSNTRFNTRRIKDFASFRLDTAVRNAFGGFAPLFQGLYGRASFAVVIFAAGCVAEGRRISVMAADTVTEHVTTVSV